jgi:hypothetical protein
MKRRADWLLIGLLVAVLCATTLVGENRSADEQKMKAPSTRNYAPAGFAALFKLLEQEQITPQRLETPWTKLTTNDKTLVVAEPMIRDVAQEEYTALKAWVEAGGTLVLFGQGVTGGIALASLGLEGVSVGFGSPELKQLSVKPNGNEELAGVHQVSAEGMLRLNWNGEADEARELIKDEKGALAMKVSLGKGEVYLFSDAIRPQNSQLARSDNALLITKIVGSNGKSVLFDEYHQGAGARVDNSATLWSAIGATGRFATYYIVALVGVLILILNRRFGSIVETPEVTLRPQTDYVSSMAKLMRRGNGAAIALQAHERAFRHELAKQTDVDQNAEHDDLAKAYQAKTGRPAYHIQSILTRSLSILQGSRQANDAELVELASAFQSARKDLQLDRHSL